jgi:predicted Zn-dependent protease
LGLSRKLTERYPRSAGAQCLRGALAYDLRQFAEALVAFRTATTIDPKFSLAYFGIAAVEATQGQYAAAIPHLQQVLKLQPNAAAAYYVLSDCAFHLGRKEESATYARKGAALDPSDGYMWLQLAKAEKALGHTDATLNAIAKAAQVSPDSGMMLAVLGFSYINLNRIQQAIAPLPTRGETSAPQLPSAITARVLPDDSRQHRRRNRISAQRRKLKFQLRPSMGASRRSLSETRAPSRCHGCAGKSDPAHAFISIRLATSGRSLSSDRAQC